MEKKEVKWGKWFALGLGGGSLGLPAPSTPTPVAPASPESPVPFGF